MADSHGRMYGMMPQQFGGPMRNAFGLGHAPPGPPMHYQGGPAWFGTGNAHPRGPARPRKRAAKFGPGDSQPAQPAPSLQALRAENRSKARKHFHRSGAPAHGTGECCCFLSDVPTCTCRPEAHRPLAAVQDHHRQPGLFLRHLAMRPKSSTPRLVRAFRTASTPAFVPTICHWQRPRSV